MKSGNEDVSKEAVIAKLEAAEALLEIQLAELESQRIERAHRDLALSIRHELATRITLGPIIRGSSREHMRIINDLPNQRIKFQILATPGHRTSSYFGEANTI